MIEGSGEASQGIKVERKLEPVVAKSDVSSRSDLRLRTWNDFARCTSHLALAIATIALVVSACPQDLFVPCDLAKVEEASYCLRCRKVRTKEELDKAGACATCGLAPEKTKVCMKSWVPKCGMHDMQPHDKPCCTSPLCCRVEVFPAPVAYRCKGCGAKAGAEDRIIHRKGNHNQEMELVCSRSGRFPHGGALPVKKTKEDEEKEEK